MLGAGFSKLPLRSWARGTGKAPVRETLRNLSCMFQGNPAAAAAHFALLKVAHPELGSRGRCPSPARSSLGGSGVSGSHTSLCQPPHSQPIPCLIPGKKKYGLPFCHYSPLRWNHITGNRKQLKQGQVAHPLLLHQHRAGGDLMQYTISFLPPLSLGIARKTVATAKKNPWQHEHL